MNAADSPAGFLVAWKFPFELQTPGAGRMNGGGKKKLDTPLSQTHCCELPHAAPASPGGLARSAVLMTRNVRSLLRRYPQAGRHSWRFDGAALRGQPRRKPAWIRTDRESRALAIAR